MLYLRTVTLSQYTSVQLENALRKSAIKRRLPLDMGSSIVNIGTDKYFLGYEGKKTLTFTRIRAFIEYLLPKLIIKPSMANTTSSIYKLRLSAFSLIIFLMFNLPWLLILLLTITGKIPIERLVPASVTCFIYWLLLLIEVRLTDLRIKKALKKHTKSPGYA
jgi:hypothetical protein